MSNTKAQISNQAQSANAKKVWILDFDIHLTFGF